MISILFSLFLLICQCKFDTDSDAYGQQLSTTSHTLSKPNVGKQCKRNKRKMSKVKKKKEKKKKKDTDKTTFWARITQSRHCIL